MFVNIINSQISLGGNRGVLAVANQLLKENKPFALAIVVNAKGSTYRKPGALALFAGDDTTRSVISGGCLETNWHKVASHVIARNEPQSLLLDTQSDDDLIFGSGSGCRGSMRVLIIPVLPENTHLLYSIIAYSFQHHQSMKLALAIDATHCARGMAWSDDREWQLGNHIDEIKFMRDASHGEYQVSLKNDVSVTVAVFDLHPAPRILLIGASVETPFLIRIGHSLGWHVTLVDHRPAQLEQYAAAADEVIHSRPVTALTKLVQPFDAALIMSHSASTDLEALQTFSARQERYVGLLGPPARRDELLSQLNETQRSSLSSR
ncbi:MAG: XdhC family protein, partial [Steroidobacter sp.]